MFLSKTTDQQSTQYAGSVGLLMQIDREMAADRQQGVTAPRRRGALADRRTRSLDDGGEFPQPSFETLAFRDTHTSFPLPTTFEETASDVSTGSKDEPETVAEVRFEMCRYNTKNIHTLIPSNDE